MRHQATWIGPARASSFVFSHTVHVHPTCTGNPVAEEAQRQRVQAGIGSSYYSGAGPPKKQARWNWDQDGAAAGLRAGLGEDMDMEGGAEWENDAFQPSTPPPLLSSVRDEMVGDFCAGLSSNDGDWLRSRDHASRKRQREQGTPSPPPPPQATGPSASWPCPLRLPPPPPPHMGVAMSCPPPHRTPRRRLRPSSTTTPPQQQLRQGQRWLCGSRERKRRRRKPPWPRRRGSLGCTT